MKRRVSIRVNLLTYFLLIIAITSSVLIGLQYHFSLKLAGEAADKTFEQIADKTTVFISETDKHLRNITNLVAHDRMLADIPEIGKKHVAMDAFVNILESHESIYSVYVGKDNGDFYEVIHMQRFPNLYERFGASPKTKWAVIQITSDGQGRHKFWQFYDETMQRVGSRDESINFDPRVRPWFNKARTTNSVIRTEPYLFNFLKASGITYAKALSTDDGVLAIDITMASLNEFLAKQRFSETSEIFVFDEYGEKYASSNPLELGLGEMPTLKLNTKPLELSDAELAYISQHPVLNISNETDWPPIDFAVRGVPKGYAIDVMSLLAQKIGFKLNFINGFTWDELVELFKQGKLDVLHSAYKNQGREDFALFTEPMYQLKTQFIVRKGLNISGIDDLKGKIVALPSGWASTKYIREHYPEISLLELPRSFDAYLAVNSGKADATLDHELAMKYVSSKYGLDQLEMGPWFHSFDNDKPQGIHMLVNPEQSLLRDMLNRALQSVSSEEWTILRQRWENPGCQDSKSCIAQAGNNIVNPIFMQTPTDKASGLIHINNQDREYFAYSAPLSSGQRLGLTEYTDTFLAPYMEKVRISLHSALFVLLLAVPLVLYAIMQILKPIRALMVENDKVALRQYKDVSMVDTHITELHKLSESLIDMADSIQAYEKAQEELMDSFIQLIADAIDAKSPYTAGHCARVPEVAYMLAQKANESNQEPFKEFHFKNDDEWREFRIGSWLHDCGKVTTPEYVVDKATKLETINNRIHEVRTRFEVLWRDAEIASLKRQLNGEDNAELTQWLEQERHQLIEDFSFIAECNIGGEFMDEAKQQRLSQIATRTWQRHFDNRIGISEDEEERFAGASVQSLPVEENLLSDKPEHIVVRTHFDHQAYQAQGFKLPVPEHLYNYGELYNLSISRGTLTTEERFKINEHVIMTIRMLEQLPLPDNMKRVPEYAGTHHETLTGTGYPRQLTQDELSLPSRIMTLADIFEALTASDRPYKKAKTLSEAIKIMSFMCQDKHIDPDVFRLFLESGVYLEYAKKYLHADQLDEVDIQRYLS